MTDILTAQKGKHVGKTTENLRSRTLPEFTEKMAGKDPVPGGGGAAALCGALAAALSSMAASLTVGKKKYQAVEEDMQKVIQQAEALRQEFLEMIDEDAEAFRPLSEAYALPHGTEEEKRNRIVIMERALARAASSPLLVMEKAEHALTLVQIAAEKGSVLAVSDAGCAAAILDAAVRSAALNVRANTRLMQNRSLAEDLNQKTDAIMKRCTEAADAVYGSVYARLRQKG